MYSSLKKSLALFIVTVLVMTHPFVYASVTSTEEDNNSVELLEGMSEGKEISIGGKEEEISTEGDNSSRSSIDNQEEGNKEERLEDNFSEATNVGSESFEKKTQDSIVEELKVADQPSMIADRSDEGQPFVLGEASLRGANQKEKTFYAITSKYFFPFTINIDGKDQVIWESSTEELLKKKEKNIDRIIQAEVLSIAGEEFLFVQVEADKGKNKPTRVFFSNSSSDGYGKFVGTPKNGLNTDISKLKSEWNETTIVAPSWVDTTKLKNKKRIGFHVVTINGKEAFTVKTDDFGWFYVEKKIEKPSQPTQPSLKTETFYTSNDKAFPVVMKDDGMVDVEASKKLLENELANITNEKDKKDAEEFIAYADAAAELLEVEGKMLLFIKTNDHTTKVFHKEAGTYLKDSFKHSVATEGALPVDADITKAIAPAWIADADKADIVYFNAVNEGYTLLTRSGHWFYAPKKDPETTPFYTSNNKEFPVVLQNEMTVDLPASKKLLEKALPTITNPEDKKAAEDFIANATDADVEIKKIHNQRILFVKTDPGTTKVFRDSKDPLFQNAFRNTQATKGAPVGADIAQAIAPNWISDAEKGDITHFVTIGNDGYTLLTKTGHWFYAPLKLNIVQFYGSNNGELEVVMKDENTVDLIQTKKRLEPKIPLLPANLQEEARDFADNATDADVVIKEIEGVKLLFVKTSKHTKVFRTPDTDAMFQNAFKEGKVMNIGVVYTDAIVKPDWVDMGKKVTHYNEIKKADKVIGYALKTEDHHWFYAPKKEFTITPFYTSNNNIVPVVMKDPMVIDLPATKSVLYPLIKDITNPKDKAFAETFIKTATEKDVEIKEIKDVKVLFVNLGTSTKAFAGEASSPFQNAFKEGKAINANIVYHSPIKPTWATSSDVKKYNEIKKADKLIGYTLKDADNHWFYASAAHRVNFDTDGVTAIADQSIPLDGKATKPTDPSKAGYRFDGWFADKAFKTAFDFTKVITEHTTVYAKWTYVSGASSSSGGSSGGGSSYSTSSTPTKTINNKNTEVEVKGDKAIRENPAILFKDFSKKCEQSIKNLNDVRLIKYYDELGVIYKDNFHRSLTRAEFLKLVINSAKIDLTSVDNKYYYSDVSSDYSLKKYIDYATAMGIVSGQNNKFRPNDIITRAEAAKIFVKIAGLKLSEKSITFSDVPASHTLSLYIQTAFDNCLLNGRKTMNGESLLANNMRIYEPEDAITLAETAKVLYNIAK